MREPNFGWEYPPGVTGREPQIAGDPVEDEHPDGCWCPDCDPDRARDERDGF